MKECEATLIWVHRSMRPQKGTFENPPATMPELSLSYHKTLTEAVRDAMLNKAHHANSDRLPWVHAWGAGGSAIFDEVEITAICRTIQVYVGSYP